MVNTFLDAVTTRLGSKLGNKYHYYVENVEQGIVKPCFTIDMVNPIERSRGPRIYDRVMPLVVHYFSDDKNNLKHDCYAVAEQALEVLEYVPFMGSVLRGEDIDWQIVDGVLQIFITYRFQSVMSTGTEENMEELLGMVTGTK